MRPRAQASNRPGSSDQGNRANSGRSGPPGICGKWNSKWWANSRHTSCRRNGSAPATDLVRCQTWRGDSSPWQSRRQKRHAEARREVAEASVAGEALLDEGIQRVVGGSLARRPGPRAGHAPSPVRSAAGPAPPAPPCPARPARPRHPVCWQRGRQVAQRRPGPPEGREHLVEVLKR